MAVVSISRIQLRRGKKNQGSGLPQLASGELGWAIDTQELYIGNGSVSEGAPYVGNTRILSESDDLFALATNYTYTSAAGNVQTGSSPSLPVLRSLQVRLDDRVSLRAFGATSNNTDHAALLQRAIDQLYLNTGASTNPAARVELIIEPGEYTLSETVYLPPYVTLRGAGADKTIFNASANAAFQTVNSTSTTGDYATDATSSTLNQARNILISGITINTQGAPALVLQSCKDSTFNDVILQGTWNIGDAVTTSNSAIVMGGLSTAVNSVYNYFKQVKIYNYCYAVSSDQDIRNNTFEQCEYKFLHSGVAFGLNTSLGVSGQLSGPLYNTVRNSVFDDIATVGFDVVNGVNNLSESNRYYNVGNDGGSPENNKFPVVRFVKKAGTSHNDWFQRSTELGYNQEFLINIPYTTEIEGSQITQLNETHYIALGEYPVSTRLFKLPASGDARGYVIDYLYRSMQVDAVRSGVITLVVDPNSTVDVNGDSTVENHSLSDEYDYFGDPFFGQNLEFKAEIYDEDNDSSVDSVAIMVLNLTSNDIADFTYTVRYKT